MVIRNPVRDCEVCGTRIICARLVTGSTMVLDAEPDDDGSWIVDFVGDETFTALRATRGDPDPPFFTAHAPTCKGTSV